MKLARRRTGLITRNSSRGSTLVDDMTAHFLLQEASGTRSDSVGASHLTDNNTVTQAAGPGGELPFAAEFLIANTETLTVASNVDIEYQSGSFTISMWIRPNTTGFHGVLNKGNGTLSDYAIRLVNLAPVFYVWGNTGQLGNLVMTATLPVNTWSAFRVWYDASAQKLRGQINNGTIEEVAYTLTPRSSDDQLTIGRYPQGGNYFTGRLAGLGYSKRAWSDSEWGEFYNNGVPKAYPFSTVAPAPEVEIVLPSAYRVFQRSGNTGDIAITGSVRRGTSSVEARFNGGAWATIATDIRGEFNSNLSTQAEGQGALEVRLVSFPSATSSMADVGIGDVFIMAGQSNMSGRGTNNQLYSHSTLKSRLFGNDYTWKNLVDPYDSPTLQVDTVSIDSAPAAGGSWAPLLATLFMADQGVPLAFVPCAKGGTSITAWLPGANHQDRTTLYGSMVYRALQTGAKVVLWWLGENDAIANMTQATYNGHLDTIANALFTDIGVKLMPCLLQDAGNYNGTQQAAINNAIIEAWGDNANVLLGPDFSDILPSVDSLHMKTDAELLTTAQRWFAKLETAFYP